LFVVWSRDVHALLAYVNILVL